MRRGKEEFYWPINKSSSATRLETVAENISTIPNKNHDTTSISTCTKNKDARPPRPTASKVFKVKLNREGTSVEKLGQCRETYQTPSHLGPGSHSPVKDGILKKSSSMALMKESISPTSYRSPPPRASRRNLSKISTSKLSTTRVSVKEPSVKESTKESTRET